MSDTPRMSKAASLPIGGKRNEAILFEGCQLERENEALRKDAELALTQAREEGRREGMREAAEICRHRSVKCSSFGAAYHALSCDGDAEAITRAAEGK